MEKEKAENSSDNSHHSPSAEKDVALGAPGHDVALLPDPDEGLSEEERQKIVFLDRTNIGNAKIDGLQEDLHMTNGQYNATLSIFFVSYSCFEPLTQIMLKRFRPSVFIPIIMTFWVSQCGPAPKATSDMINDG
ncbi:MAG: hypothetical protein Q9227_002129 [Pyrenula ochraceoflavens]